MRLLAFREEDRLKLSENNVLFGLKRDENGEWKMYLSK